MPSASRLLIIGHRGDSAHAPENTLAAFELAHAGGADGVEFDVRLAADGVPVCIHDATLERTALRPGAVARLTSSELAAVDAGTWFNRRFPALAREAYTRQRVPTLAEVLELVGPRSQVIYVEMKSDAGADYEALAGAVVGVIRRSEFAARAVVKCFAHEALGEVKRLAPEIRTAALFERRLSRPLLPPRQIVERARACGADEISLQRTLVRRRTVEEARRHGLSTLAWTVDDPAWLRRACALGLRAVITNRPALMRARLEEMSRGG